MRICKRMSYLEQVSVTAELWHPASGLPLNPGSQTHLLGAPYSQWELGPHPGLQMAGPTGGMQKRSGSPTKPSWHRQMPESASHLVEKRQE